jgi:hypothetical protein
MCPRSSDSHPSRFGEGAGGVGAGVGAGGVGVWLTIRTSRRPTETFGATPPAGDSRPAFASPTRGLFDSAGCSSAVSRVTARRACAAGTGVCAAVSASCAADAFARAATACVVVAYACAFPVVFTFAARGESEEGDALSDRDD